MPARAESAHRSGMASETTAVTLSAEQMKELVERLGKLRHNVNNNLTLIISAAELLRRKPELSERMVGTISDQSGKIEQALRQFSDDLGCLLKVQKH
ncbi:MAG: hypothetical protein HY043_10825 [Verrucomicrobia bacterium]|nr:hypothetical protein [Verrucomicrobiota bacterium]